MLDQDSEETLDGAIERAVHHQGLVRFSVFGNVFEVEPAGQSEIELNRRKLPQTADGIHQFHVDLRAIKRGFIGHDFHFEVQALRRLAQSVFSQLPLVG